MNRIRVRHNTRSYINITFGAIDIELLINLIWYFVLFQELTYKIDQFTLITAERVLLGIMSS
jgi:hypothetical protein